MKKIFFISSLLIATLLVSCKDNSPKTQTGSNADLESTTTVSAMPKSPKRGVSFNIHTMQDAVILSDFISWYYNWGNTAYEDVLPWLESCNIDFCPMCWSRSYNANNIRKFVQAHPNTKYLLGYNEPNLTDQANMIPDSAAKDWPNVVALAKELNLKLGAPAMNYGTLAGYSDPIRWLDQFFSKPGCSLDDIDFIPIHCYMMSPSAVKGYVEKFYKYNKPIWMTEFCAWENITNVETQKTYMTQVVNYFETDPMVERYAWFIPRSGNATNSKPFNQLLTKMDPYELTELGRIYAGISSQDKSVCISSANPIRAYWYSQASANDIYVKNTTDPAEPKQLMIFNLVPGYWLQYQVDVVNPSSALDIRYTTSLATTMNIYVDGLLTKTVNIPATGTDWSTYTISDFTVNGSALKGKHYLRVETVNGYINLGYFQFK